MAFAAQPVNDFQIYHDLMADKVQQVLLVASPFDAFFMEEDGRLASRIINEYQGLNLSRPPRLHRVASGSQALEYLERDDFDLVITMPLVDDMDALALSDAIRKLRPGLPVVLLAHSPRAVPQAMGDDACPLLGGSYVWSGDPELLLAIIKNVEDHRNVDADTQRAQVRVLLLVEDSPLYKSFLLPLIYREVVEQTQAVLAESLNEEHRLLKMRARPKILVAETFEKALAIYHRYRPYMLGILSDVRFPRQGQLDDQAGLVMLEQIRADSPDLPQLILSSEPGHRQRAEAIPALFVDKNSPHLRREIHHFFLNQLGFGDFVFRLPDGTVVDWARNLRDFERKLASIPDASLLYHARGYHFVNWIMARSEVATARKLAEAQPAHFGDVVALRRFLIDCLHGLRRRRQAGIVAQFNPEDYDPEVMDFVRIGGGSLGGKARGLAFMARHLLEVVELPDILQQYPIHFPKTLVIASEGFDAFVQENSLREPEEGEEDRDIAARFLAGTLPVWLADQLRVCLAEFRQPLAVRSSSLQEDAFFKPYAGLFHTRMLTNSHPDFVVRLRQLEQAVKLVYASAWFAGPRAFAQREGQARTDSMAVIVQELIGQHHGDLFFPAISGVAQSYNYYPVGRLEAEEGVAHIALGFGKTVVEGERSLRFSPAHPKVLPQFGAVKDLLNSVQREFYALELGAGGGAVEVAYDGAPHLARLPLTELDDAPLLGQLCSTYVPEEDRIRDGLHPGQKVLTFAPLLKFNTFPLAGILAALVNLGRQAVGAPVEIEFVVDLAPEPAQSRFYFLQIRPMVAGSERFATVISRKDEERAFCLSSQALGYGVHQLKDIVLVDPEAFETRHTREIAREIGRLNGELVKEGLPYLLIGPGRWGSADPWLGIPVQWQDISGVGAIIELRNAQLRVDPSEGSHFFQNITSLGIPYVTVSEGSDRLAWDWLLARKPSRKTSYLRHLRLRRPLTVKIDWETSRCVMVP